MQQTSLLLSASSLCLIILAVLAFRRAAASALNRLFFLLAILLDVLLLTGYVVADYFTGTGVNEGVIYHLRYGLMGAGFGAYWLPMLLGLLVPVAAVLGVWMFCLRPSYRPSEKAQHQTLVIGSYLMLLLAALVSPTSVDLIQLRDHWLYSDQSDPRRAADFYEYYRKPTLIQESEAKNLVVIYAESLERTYFDESVFPGLITDLRELEGKGVSFTNIKQVPGTGWTVGGMTASLLGLPLFSPSHGNSMSGMDRFMPSAVSIGDMLSEVGYHLVYMGGASLEFGGKGSLFRSHGFSEVLGYKALSSKITDNGYLSPWGLYDDTLLSLAYEKFLQLSDAERPFGLFLLTLDTHHPSGHPSLSVRDQKYLDGSNSILNAVAGSDELIARFARRLLNSRHAQNTVIVILSDHLAMRNTAWGILEDAERRNLFIILSQDGPAGVQISVPGSLLDVGPTTLPFIGYRGSLGLGRNLMSESEQLVKDVLHIQNNLLDWRDPVVGFWDFPAIRTRLLVDAERNIVQIDDRTFKPPLLIELNRDLTTTLRFEHDRSEGQKTLIDHIASMSRGSRFVLIDHGHLRGTSKAGSQASGLDVLFGTGSEFLKKVSVQSSRVFRVEEIRQVFGLPTTFSIKRIAHAGGGIEGETYTNSLEALDSALEQGFRYLELDFSFTSDNRLVCIHDWHDSFRRAFGIESRGKVTRDEFKRLVSTQSQFHRPTLEELARWMRSNPDAYIVTDIKERNVEGLRTVSQVLPDSRRRVIPQIYHPQNYAKVKSLGFDQIIWSLYRYSGSDEQVLGWTTELLEGPVAVAMSRERADSGLPSRLRRAGIPTYVHTVNDSDEAMFLMGPLEVDEIYTDFLAPEARSP